MRKVSGGWALLMSLGSVLRAGFSSDSRGAVAFETDDVAGVAEEV